MINTYLPVGPTLTADGQCTFTVWAPLCSSVSVVIDNSPQSIWPMQKNNMGYWTATVPHLNADTQYWYKLNDELLRPDPASRFQPKGVHGPSAIVNPHFNWTDDEWTGIDPSNLIIYELHTGTFTPEGTFQGIINKLPYLHELGITAIELMPIAQFPGSRNWGYDGVYPFAVQNSYGTPYDLKQLVNTAHQYGIAVVLDVVYNHAGPEGNYLNDFAPYFTDKYKTPWGNAMNFDSDWCDGVRNFFIQNALMWLDEYHIDALRMDAVHAIYDFSALHFTQQLTESVRILEHQTGSRKLLIAELDLNNPRYVTPIEQGGYGMDAQWVDEFHHALHSVITGETNGYYEDFGGLELLAKSLDTSYVYTGQYSPHRKKNFGVAPHTAPYNQFIAFTQNHDQIGNRLLGDRLTKTLSPEALKLTAATLLLSPHVPLLFMGEEYGEKKPFQYFTNHSDEQLIKQLREGRRKEFAAFNWDGGIPDPQADDTFQQSQLSWQAAVIPGLQEFYKHLIHFRRTKPAMKNYTRDEAVQQITIADNVLRFERHGNNSVLVIFLHFGQQPQEVQHEVTNTYKKLIDSSGAEWNGPGSKVPEQVAAGESFTLNPFSAVVFEQINQ